MSDVNTNIDEGSNEGGGNNAGDSGSGDSSNSISVEFGALSDDVRASLGKDKIFGYEGLIKQFYDQKSHLGNSIRVPSNDASDADRQTFYAKLQDKVPNLIPKPDREDKEAWDALQTMLGKPDAATDYTLPELAESDAARADNFRAKAHELGLTQNQFESIIKSEYENNTQANEANAATLAADLKALAQDWGVTYDKRLANIRNFADQTGAPKDILDMLDANQIGSEALKWFHTLTTNVSGGAEIRTQAAGGTDDVPPEEALSRAREIMTRLGSMKPSDPQYAALHTKRDFYMEMAYPDAAKGLDGLRASRN